MKALKLTFDQAKSIYPTAAPELKTILELNFGKQSFSTKLIDRINTWRDVVAEMGEEECRLPYQNPRTVDDLAYNAHFRITKTIKLFKRGEKCNYSPENNQNKYWPWFEWLTSKLDFGFSHMNTPVVYMCTAVGPRLSSLSSQAAKHIATVVCAEDYNIYFTE